MARKVLYLVEDSAADARVVSRAVEKLGDDSVTLTHFENAENALKYFMDGRRLDEKYIVLLDLNMPGADGFAFLERFKSLPEHKKTPVVVWTTSGQPEDVSKSYELQANSFLVKPMGLKESTAIVHDICHYWFDRNVLN